MSSSFQAIRDAAAAAAAAATRGKVRSRAGRAASDRTMRVLLFAAALFSIVTTAAIIMVLVVETAGFFTTTFPAPYLVQEGDNADSLAARFGGTEALMAVNDGAWPPDRGLEPGTSIRIPKRVSPTEFLFGTRWEPLLGAERHFGVLPLVTGTLMVTVIAAAFALPIGLITAIYLSEYAKERTRAVIKPILEVLAGVPTVVYGFFALMVITPYGLQAPASFITGLLRGEPMQVFGGFNAMGAGLAVGIMILPIISSLSDDALRAVPRSLREAAFGLGSTRFDVSVRVVVPAALSGITASFLLAMARAVGETMIVALAAGGMAQLSLNPADQMQTITAYMVQIFLGDAPAFSIEYQSSFAVAAVLFVMTLTMAVLGSIILRRFREVYE
ncbi:MAG: phosphate ABC transporter permease subunit PstC [Phycisphaeraceae bacterium]|nr:phosphate ABC transporter permease subunit PstC [Phycisphaeraceae bacterium]